MTTYAADLCIYKKERKKYTFWIQSITQPHLFTHPDDEHVDISLHSC